MVVKFIQSSDLLTLQDKVNDFIVAKDKEFRSSNRTSFSFRVDLKVVQGFNYGTSWADNDGKIVRPGPEISKLPYFIAVIQY